MSDNKEKTPEEYMNEMKTRLQEKLDAVKPYQKKNPFAKASAIYFEQALKGTYGNYAEFKKYTDPFFEEYEKTYEKLIASGHDPIAFYMEARYENLTWAAKKRADMVIEREFSEYKNIFDLDLLFNRFDWVCRKHKKEVVDAYTIPECIENNWEHLLPFATYLCDVIKKIDKTCHLFLSVKFKAYGYFIDRTAYAMRFAADLPDPIGKISEEKATEYIFSIYDRITDIADCDDTLCGKHFCKQIAKLNVNKNSSKEDKEKAVDNLSELIDWFWHSCERFQTEFCFMFTEESLTTIFRQKNPNYYEYASKDSCCAKYFEITHHLIKPYEGYAPNVYKNYINY